MTVRRAFTLVEVLTGVAIFAIAVVALMELIATQVRAEARAEDMTRAVLLVENMVEELRLQDPLAEEKKSGEFEAENTGFSWEYEITPGEVDRLWNLTVTVRWADSQGPREHRVQTMLADR